MKRYLVAAAAVCLCASASADLVASNGTGDELRLFERPCTAESIRAAIRPEWVDKFQAGQAIIGGKVIKVCWIDTSQGSYYVMPDGAEQGIAYSVTIFVNQPGV